MAREDQDQGRDEKQPERKFRPGDVVRLRSGVQLMTVEYYQHDGKLVCWVERAQERAAGVATNTVAYQVTLAEAVLEAVPDGEVKALRRPDDFAARAEEMHKRIVSGPRKVPLKGES